MKFTLSWLKEHLRTDADLDTIAETLTAIGLEVESVENLAEQLAPFTVAYVRDCRKHPNADKLSVCSVETGDGEFEVVCGAPNARTGMKGVFAPVGTTVPGIGLTLKKAKIRGVESSGMLVSEKEMGLSEDHEGIIEVPEDAEIGRPFAEVLGLDDPVIEIAITPNRQDCLGVHGIARDLAAAGLGTLKPIETKTVEGAFKSPIGVEFHLDDAPEACPLFAGRYIRGVKNGESPEWLQKRLRAIGLRPISALVDITNLFTYDRARPLHVYDAKKVSGTIIVRLSEPGETIAALDGRTYETDDTMCLIADEAGPLGFGGVIGGEGSGCTEETTDVFLEAALFDPVRTATTGRKLNLQSDARYRFERGVDPEYTIPGMEDATRLILELCGGEASEPVITGGVPDYRKTITLPADRVETLGGIDIPAKESAKILDSLGFAVKSGQQALQVTPPSWRADIDGAADLVEEVTRIYGYDRIAAVDMDRPESVARPTLTARQKRVRAARRRLAANGLVEAVTWSFMPSSFARLFTPDGVDPVVLENPISSDLDAMRPSVLPNLITALGRNADRGQNDIRLFEVGPQYLGVTAGEQATVAAGIRGRAEDARHWRRGPGAADVFDAKRDALSVLAECGAPVDSVQSRPDAPPWYHPGRSGALTLGPKNTLAWFGEIHPLVLERLDVKGPVVGFEVFLDILPEPKKTGAKTRPALEAPDYPAVVRDFAFVVGRDVPAADVIKAAGGADKSLIADVTLFDVYEGKGIGADEKSLAIAVTLQPADRTLTDPEIDEIAGKIVKAVEKATGGRLRA